MNAPQTTQPGIVDSESRPRINVQRIGLKALNTFRGNGAHRMSSEDWALFLRHKTTFPMPVYRYENGHKLWTVRSTTDEKTVYEVREPEIGTWTCTCPAGIHYTDRWCVHIYLARHEEYVPATPERRQATATAEIEAVLSKNPFRNLDTERLMELPPEMTSFAEFHEQYNARNGGR
jgi:hypothetical protein